MGELVVTSFDDPRLPELLRRPYNIEEYVEKVRPIVRDVAEKGLEALREYSRKFDKVEPKFVVIDALEAWEIVKKVEARILDALKRAIDAVYAFHMRLYEELLSTPRSFARMGITFKPLIRPLQSVGAYVPGGEHPYPSSAVMTVVPARVAGVERIVVATPPMREGDNAGLPNPLAVAAAVLAGATEILVAGGAQAIAALAYGLKGVLEPVDKIVGPGSPYVEAAKLLVSHRVGIDMVAGPSEVAVIADGKADARSIALEMLSQLEHGPFSTALLVTNSPWLVEAVQLLLEKHVKSENMGRAIIVKVDTLEKGVKIVEKFAPEHLYIEADGAEKLAARIRNAGIVSIGIPTALTDYSAGPSHVLPTGGYARVRGGLTPLDFVKVSVVVSGRLVHPQLVEAAIALAEAEGFKWHAESLRYWLEKSRRGLTT
ncbi:histidinol dehydrogenase [Pyrolobus fumarii 1A]|uniref:Histidinol dehydrogenase n=1 Tax=Pyrolobus fumarii (strain DSM 11204 / 1A) TaxID=694429 RepID=G0EH81_PYRF1|nr:histidinol dehydrogenase [Pyrolobus fumarii]AEM39305.1 histidinol dehydrogenase [Pyrolobus fumarii 1A]